jgi:hypothetical protein
MRSLAATCLALLAAWHGGVHADPAAPQLNPTEGRREDAQRLREQLRDLDSKRPPAPAQAALPPGLTFDPPSKPASVEVGVSLLWVAGFSALTTFAVYELAQHTPGDAYDTAEALGIITTAATGAVGLALVLGNSGPRVTPTATPKAAGLAISGHL